MNEQSPRPGDVTSPQERNRAEILRNILDDKLMIVVGGALCAVSDLAPHSISVLNDAARTGGFALLVGGLVLALKDLEQLSNIVPRHFHPPLQNISSQSQDKERSKIQYVPPNPPTPKQRAQQFARQYVKDNAIHSEYRKGLEEVGLSARAVNALVRNAETGRRMPFSVAGLRVFLRYEQPLVGRGIGDVTREEIRNKIAAVPFPRDLGEYNELTLYEKNQMKENGFTQDF